MVLFSTRCLANLFFLGVQGVNLETGGSDGFIFYQVFS